MITAPTINMKPRCDLCNCEKEDASSLTLASPKDVIIWSTRMLITSASAPPKLILCPECVLKINDVGSLLWQWKDRIVFAGRWEEEEEDIVKREPSYDSPSFDPASPSYGEVQREVVEEDDEEERTKRRRGLGQDLQVNERIDKCLPDLRRNAQDSEIHRPDEYGSSSPDFVNAAAKIEEAKKRRGKPPKSTDSKSSVLSGGMEEQLMEEQLMEEQLMEKQLMEEQLMEEQLIKNARDSHSEDKPGMMQGANNQDANNQDANNQDANNHPLPPIANEDSSVTKSPSEQFICADCGKSFTRERALITHASIHTGERPFKCEACGKSFRQKYSLDLHKLTVHSDERPFTCDVCGKTFKLRMKLDDHKRTHTGVKPHSCDTCGARFANRSDVTKHMRFHTGERPFQCSTCDKTFYTSSNLRTHETIHAGSKPFHCQFCGKSFGRKGNLLEHCRGVHLDEKPFKCHSCGQGFRRKKMLSDHQLSCRLEAVKKDESKDATITQPNATNPSAPFVSSSTSEASLDNFASTRTPTSECLPRSNNDFTITCQK